MVSGNNNWVNKFYAVIMPKIYGIGAAVVIAGAMFKLLNWPGGALMLGLGLTTEAIIFFLSSFEPVPKEVDWSIVYPELNENYTGTTNISRKNTTSINSVSDKLDEMFIKAKIDGALLERLGNGMLHLTESVSHIANLSHSSQITAKYTANLEKASETLESIYNNQENLLITIQKLDGITENVYDFHKSMQRITETLNDANTSYNTELKHLSQKLEGTQIIYSNVSDSMKDLQDASSETESFRLELSKLNEKLESLNKVYGNMLMAFKS